MGNQTGNSADYDVSRDTPFDEELRTSVAHLRASLSEVLAAVGANLRVPHSITRQFGVDKSLASKLARMIREPDPYAAALDVPGEEAMRIFSRSMRDAGAPAQSLETLREAVESFQQMVKTHCGDRSTLEMIAGAATGRSGKQQQQQELFRKLLFRGASAVFGVQARVEVTAHFVAPSPNDPDQLDIAIVGGLIDLRRIRSDAAWAIASMKMIDEQGVPKPLADFEPVDPQTLAQTQAPLIAEFCSTPIPELRVTETNDSTRRFELPEGPVGNPHAVTFISGWIYRNAISRFHTPDDPFNEHFVTITTPSELFVHDLYAHKDLPFARRPTTVLYNQLPGSVSYPRGARDRGQLQLSESLQDLSGQPPHVATPDVQNYAALVQRAIERMGYVMEDFFGVRLQMRYPPIPSMLMYRYERPKRSE